MHLQVLSPTDLEAESAVLLLRKQGDEATWPWGEGPNATHVRDMVPETDKLPKSGDLVLVRAYTEGDTDDHLTGTYTRVVATDGAVRFVTGDRTVVVEWTDDSGVPLARATSHA